MSYSNKIIDLGVIIIVSTSAIIVIIGFIAAWSVAITENIKGSKEEKYDK